MEVASGVPTHAAVVAAARDGAVPVGVHLVGSVPLAGAAEVFERIAPVLGDRLRRIPDGESGPRADWILWQYPVFSSRPQLELGPSGEATYRGLPKLRVRPGGSLDDLELGSLGYAAAATSSYRDFAAAKADGLVPAHCRFQVALPTPLAPVSAFVSAEDQPRLEPIYELRLLAELDEILAAIPAKELAIQWDARFELGMLEGSIEAWFADVREGVLERLLRLGARVPAEVEVGFHLCCDRDAHDRLAGTDDLGDRSVEVANALAAGLARPLHFIHLPVPSGAIDGDCLRPLSALRLDPETELYLGLVDPGDNVEDTRRRIAAADEHLEAFGVATACGWGRGGAAGVDKLLELHRAVSRPLDEAINRGSSPRFHWPEGFERIPDRRWTTAEVREGSLSSGLGGRGPYENLDPAVEELASTLRDGDLLVDHCGGAATLLDRLRSRIPDREVGVLVADPSTRLLRIALQKYGDDPLVALRSLPFATAEGRLRSLDEVIGPELLARGADAICALSAIDLRADLTEIARSWTRALRPGGKVLISSPNLGNPRAAGEWVLDDTARVIGELAEGLVRGDARYERYLTVLEDDGRMDAHTSEREAVFPRSLPLGRYLDALERGGLRITEVREQTIGIDAGEWCELIRAEHAAVLGWVGGTERVDGREPAPTALADRLAIIDAATDAIFGGRSRLDACCTLITATRPGDPGPI